ncbi:MAG: hypothetical protein Q9223_001541 [Gallowayella weberi]
MSRFNKPILGMQKVMYTAFASITPLPQVIRRLEELYINIIEACMDEWAKTPRMPGFYFSDDVFAFAMSCQGGVIPWEFVQEVADMLWESTARGSTALFAMVYSSPNRDVLIKISLTLMQHQLEAASGQPGTGTGGSTDTNWREGSVPSVGS